jgi:hypothetical protein
VSGYYRANQAELARLEEKFRLMEQDALSVVEAPLGSRYLCFRLDGIKVSKRYLKDSLVHEAFGAALRSSIQTVYHLLRACTGEEYGEREEGNFFLCAFCISDEVSFILNNHHNYLGNRVFKTGTSLAGTLSGALSLRFQAESKKHGKKSASGHRYPQVMAFDARPLLLDVHGEVEEYLRHRWLLAGRNALCKVLRLNNAVSGDDVYKMGRSNDLPGLCELIHRHGLESQVHQVMQSFTLFLPSSLTQSAELDEYTAKNGTDNIDDLCAALQQLRDSAP